MSKHLALGLLSCSLLIWFCGCDGNMSQQPEKLLMKSGNSQAGACGSQLPNPLVVEVLSSMQTGLLDSKGSRHGVGGVEVLFEPMDPESGIRLSPDRATTDRGGCAKTKVTLPSKMGDFYIRASFERPQGGREKVVFRVISGVVKLGDNQEGRSQEKVGNPFAVKLADCEGMPLEGVKVYFRIAGAGADQGAKIDQDIAVTDKDGQARTWMTLGKQTGQYYVMAEIADDGSHLHIRGVQFKAMAVDSTALIVSLIGGLALFIFGMSMMSNNLQLVAGDRLKSALDFFTRNRLTAVLAGTAVTAVIQSSSACTVMVVGFVNAGLLTLQQSVGVILGANIGTTVTAQIISFKLEELAYPAIAAGLIITLLSRQKTKKFWGQVLMGFGLLFLGMTIIGDTLKPLKNSPSFISFFHGFDCTPVNGVMPLGSVLWAIFIGTVMTILIQSSSATIGLALALAGSGLINFYTAVPLILGDNIGTTSTAILASIGTNVTAKRAAFVHFLFNTIGVMYMFVLFYVPYHGQPVFLHLVDRVAVGDVFSAEPENIERHIAMAHTMFNVFNVIVFFPLMGWLAALARVIIPRPANDKAEQISYLEPRLLKSPAIAIDQIVNELSYMMTRAWKNTQECFECLMNNNLSKVDQIMSREARINNLQERISSYIAELSQQSLTEGEVQLLPELIHMVNDIERAGDLAKNILEMAEHRNQRKLEFSSLAIGELNQMFDLVRQQYENLKKAFEEREEKYIRVTAEFEEKINRLEEEVTQNHTKRLEQRICNVASGIPFLQIVGNFEKIGDRFSNVSDRLEYIILGQIENLERHKKVEQARTKTRIPAIVPERSGGTEDPCDLPRSEGELHSGSDI